MTDGGIDVSKYPPELVEKAVQNYLKAKEREEAYRNDPKVKMRTKARDTYRRLKDMLILTKAQEMGVTVSEKEVLELMRKRNPELVDYL